MEKKGLEFHTVTIHRSLTRPQLIAGCDREMFIMLALFSILLIIPGGIMSGSVINIVFGSALIVFGTSLLSWMTKKDSSLRAVFVRSVKYKHKYLARSSVKAVTYRKFDSNWV